MTKTSKNMIERKGGMMMFRLRLIMEKLQRSLLPSTRVDLNGDIGSAKTVPVPEYVKGHFAVSAVLGSESKRFLVELCYLTNPEILKLLEQEAKEEFEFKQEGALIVPGRPDELQRILEYRRKLGSCGDGGSGSGRWITIRPL